MAPSSSSNSRPSLVKLRLVLRRWGLRLRLVESMSWGLWSGVVGLALGLALAVAARLLPLLATRWLVVISGSLAVGGVVLGVALAWIWPRPPVRLARTFDRQLALAERLVTAWEIGIGRLRVDRAMGAAQMADALAAAARVDVRSRLPLQASRRALLAFGGLALALALLLALPNRQQEVLLRREAVEEALEEEIADLEQVRQDVVDAQGLTEAEREMLLQALDEAISALDEGDATAEEALAALSEAEQALAELQDPGAGAVEDGLSEAGERMADSEVAQEISEALAQGDYQQAAEALAAFGGTEGEPLTREEELELAAELAEAAEALADGDPELAEQLAQAAEAIERGDVAQAREAIRRAAQEMAEAGERVERQETVEGALSELQEGRGEVAEASGSPSDGPGDQPGGGQGGQQAGGPGGQQGGQQGGQPGGGAVAGGGQQQQPGHSEDAGTGAPYDELYVPDRIAQEGTGVDVGREGGGDEGIPIGETGLPAPEGGAAGVPYQEVYADYASEAGAALDGTYIPLGLKQYVRDYFSSLEPE